MKNKKYNLTNFQKIEYKIKCKYIKSKVKQLNFNSEKDRKYVLDLIFIQNFLLEEYGYISFACAMKYRDMGYKEEDFAS